MNSNDSKSHLSRSSLAKETGVGVETIRYYERRGLIEPAHKEKHTHPHYSQRSIEQLKFVKRSQNAGFTLKEIETLLSLGSDHCVVTKTLAKEKLESIKTQIAGFQSMLEILQTLIEECDSNEEQGKCGLFETLQDKETK